MAYKSCRPFLIHFCTGLRRNGTICLRATCKPARLYIWRTTHRTDFKATGKLTEVVNKTVNADPPSTNVRLVQAHVGQIAGDFEAILYRLERVLCASSRLQGDVWTAGRCWWRLGFADVLKTLLPVLQVKCLMPVLGGRCVWRLW